MSESLRDLLETDEALDLLAERGWPISQDPVLAGLACLARGVDLHPLPGPTVSDLRPVRQARACGWALSVTVAMVITSGGIAAAVSDDPLAPIHYVRDHVTKLTPQRGSSGTVLDGARPWSKVSQIGVVVVVPPRPAASDAHPAGTAPVLDFAKVRTPAAGRVPSSDPSLGFAKVGAPAAGRVPSSGPSLGFAKVGTPAAGRVHGSGSSSKGHHRPPTTAPHRGGAKGPAPSQPGGGGHRPGTGSQPPSPTSRISPTPPGDPGRGKGPGLPPPPPPVSDPPPDSAPVGVVPQVEMPLRTSGRAVGTLAR